MTEMLDLIYSLLSFTPEKIPNLSSENLLIVGSTRSCIDAIIVACMRKLQLWVTSSIIAEFRLHTGRKILDLEQFIERFDTLSFQSKIFAKDDLKCEDQSKLNLNINGYPTFLHPLIRLYIDDQSALASNHNSLESLQRPQDEYDANDLFSLTFPAKNTLISSAVVYDPLLRYL
jgi:hypothetical protein